MENIDAYFNFLLDRYKLRHLYVKYLLWTIIFVYIRETFFWITILTTQQNVSDKAQIKKIIILLFSILGISIVFENISQKYKTYLTVELEKAHLEYCIFDLNSRDKKDIIKMNISQHFQYVESVKQGLLNIIQEKKAYTIVTATFITVLISSRKINIYLVLGLLTGFNSIIYYIQKSNIVNEESLNIKNIEIMNNIRNYVIDSKQKIVNSDFNIKHCIDLFDDYYKNNIQLLKIENSVNSYNAIMVLLITLIIVYIKHQTSSMLDIFIYILIVYDLDFFVDSLFSIYKLKKSYIKINQQLKSLFDKESQDSDNLGIQNDKNKIQNLTISKLHNTAPSIDISKPIVLKQGDKILCNGNSGEGKTTFFKYLKAIETPDMIELRVNNENSTAKSIENRVYITIQNNKPTYDCNIYDYVTNYEKEPNKDLVEVLLKIVNLHNTRDISEMSGGEQTRLHLAHTLYNVLKKDYDIILFDEIDVNLDTHNAKSILTNISEIFSDKILLFILHNEELKDMFDKQLIFKNHVIYSNF